MEKRIASSALADDTAATNLLDILEGMEAEVGITDSIFYYNFPIFRDESNTLYRSKTLYATRTHGLFIFAVIGTAQRDPSLIGRADKELTQLDTILYSKFLRSKVLRKNKREISLSVNAAIVGLGEDLTDGELDSLLVSSETDLRRLISHNAQAELTQDQWSELTSLLEGGKGISKQDERDITGMGEKSRAVILANLENRIANFDRDQRSAAISIVRGPQRIRGIAGSGKTIMLAMKAAHIHLDNPDAEILFTFWTKSLYDLIKQQITRFYRQFNDTDPNWEKLHVLHSWGGKNAPGVYYNTCIENGRTPLRFSNIIPERNRSKFDTACHDILRYKPLKQIYDYVLIDEGQDLPASFYQICFEICNGGPVDRSVVWAYDELQTIMEAEPQDVHRTFGYLDDKTTPKIDLERAQDTLSKGILTHDIVLKRSYRNPPEILVCAHALGMGIYGQQAVQSLENKEHWEDLGYEVKQGECLTGEDTVISRPNKYSPLNLSSYVDSRDIIKVFRDPIFSNEIDWIVKETLTLIRDGLKAHDILIISLDDRNARTYFARIAEKLSKYQIGLNNLLDSPYSVPKFVVDHQISASTVYRAKGNEAAVVFVVGVDAIEHNLDDIRIRNKIFTSFTRSRAWLRVSGTSDINLQIHKEIQIALDNFPNLIFKYPDINRIRTIQRDLSAKSSKLRELQLKVQELGISDLDPQELLGAIKSGQPIKK